MLAQSRLMILYREKTQIRLCINITDTGKRVKSYILEYIIIIFCSFSYQRDMPKITFRLKNVLLHDQAKR